MTAIIPYRIAVPDEKLEKLHQKLKLTEFPDELEDAQWKYGVPLAEIKKLTKYWIEEYDWRKVERELNRLPHFQIQIAVNGFDPLPMHFIHQKSEVEGAIPLLFVHGWPGSFFEGSKLLPLLKGGNGQPAFHVVMPSLANYGFSGGVTKGGFGLEQQAEACHGIMLALGYNQYVTQGGDWGSYVTRLMGHKYPKHCKASHFNMAMAREPLWTSENPKPGYTESEKAALKRAAEWNENGRGYFNIQSSKPATLAFSLRDSPAGLLAWIYEKLVDWSDNYPWTPEEVITWTSIYLFSTAGPQASTYTYYEALHANPSPFPIASSYIDVPVGWAEFPGEIAYAPKSWRLQLGPIVSEKVFDRGGHFAAWENPEGLAGHLAEMFGRGGGAEGVVKGKTGY